MNRSSSAVFTYFESSLFHITRMRFPATSTVTFNAEKVLQNMLEVKRDSDCKAATAAPFKYRNRSQNVEIGNWKLEIWPHALLLLRCSEPFCSVYPNFYFPISSFKLSTHERSPWP
jgi:hypothetical protein